MATETSAPTGRVEQRPAHELARPHVPARSVRSELRAIRAVWRRELIRFSRDRLRILTSLVQPFLFLFVLGTGLSVLVSRGT
jgi:ABC-2 type transport system permease protein